jgi:hypothetical protein
MTNFIKSKVEVGQYRLCRHTNLVYKVTNINGNKVDIQFPDDNKDTTSVIFDLEDIGEDLLATELIKELV